MSEVSSIKLPLLSRKHRLPPVPDQPRHARYGLISRICPEPPNTQGYLVEYLKGSQARILALITGTGEVYRVDDAVTEIPDAAPDLSIMHEGSEEGGGIYLHGAGTEPLRVGGFSGTVTGLLRGDEGTWHGQHALPYRAFMATLFLMHCLFAPAKRDEVAGEPTIDMGLKELGRPVEIFEGFRSLPLPDAIEAMLFRIDATEDPSGIERYARRVLGRFDLTRLRAIAMSGEVHIARIERTGAFYIVFDRKNSSNDDKAFTLSLETALNRISHLLDPIGPGLAPLSASPSEEACQRMDSAALQALGTSAGSVFDRGQRENDWRQPGGIACGPGGEWDVRTRMAHLCEGLSLVASLECLFRYEADTQTMGVEFIAPTPAFLPADIYSAADRTWVAADMRDLRAEADELARRMAMTLMAASFGASLNIERCVVRLVSVEDRPGQAFACDRAAFLSQTLERTRDFGAHPLDEGWTADALATYAIPADSPELAIFLPPCSGKAAEPRHDHRALPEPLRAMLLADTAADLEVMEAEGDPAMERVAQLRELALRDRAGAIEGLTRLVEELSAHAAAAEALAESPVVSRYAEGYFNRMLLGLDEEDRSRRILRAPDALFYAQMEIATLLSRDRRYEEAVVEARKLLDMAPTAGGAHFALINVLAHLERFDEVIEVARHGLSCALDREGSEYYFYRLAFAYWREGDAGAALACYRMVSPHSSLFSAAQEEMRQLMAELRLQEPPDLDAARAEIARLGISLPPSERVLGFLSDATVMLCDAGFHFLAARCCFEMWRIRSDDELGLVCRSLNW